MRKWVVLLAGVGGLGLLAAIVGALGLQYLVQQSAPTALRAWLDSRAGLDPAAAFGETGRAFRAQGRRSDDFGPAGASPSRSNMPLCYDKAGKPVSSDDPGDAVCHPVRSTRFIDSDLRLRDILRDAKPGDVVEFLPGTYRFKGVGFYVLPVGRADAPIVLRAGRLGDVHLEFDMGEGFAVQSPYWVFENLEIKGVCTADSDCEHAFHITRKARGTVLRNNRISDFNAQVKINAGPGDSGIPDDILIDHNSFIDSRPRKTGYAVTKVDSVRAGGLTVSGNVFADFAKQGSDQRSYAAFSKGGGRGNRFERNLVICEWMHRGGARIGLSLGGGGTADQFCAGGSCKVEDYGGLIRSNVIVGCGDAGIYMRRAADARIERNLLVATRGIDGRFDTTRATITGNILDGRIMAWKGATLTGAANIASDWRAALRLPITTAMFAGPTRGDFRANGGWAAAPVEPGTRDFCGTVFGPNAAAGPFSAACAPDIPALR